MEKTLVRTAFAILVSLAAIAATTNYIMLTQPFEEAVSQDSRNAGVSIRVHYKYYIDPFVVVFDLRKVSPDNSVLFLFSEVIKNTQYNSARLASSGKPKFSLGGEYFHWLGVEFGKENPVYMIRTMPEHVLKMNGAPAFSTWTGGILGVLARQMEDFSEFHKQWYMRDLANVS